MLNSVFTTLKSQSERLKESINTNLSSLQNSETLVDLKTNVIQKTAWIQSSVTQTLQPYLLNAQKRNTGGRNSQSHQVPNLHQSKITPSSSKGNNIQNIPSGPVNSKKINYNNGNSNLKNNNSNKQMKQRSLSSYFRPRIRTEYASVNNNEDDENLMVEMKTVSTPEQKNRIQERKQGFNQSERNGRGYESRSLITLRDHETIRMRSDGNENESAENSETETESEEDENVTEKFSRAAVWNIYTRRSQRTNQRRSDRDEIRRRLALESEELNEKSGGRKPSLHSRLQSSMNLQICFMNETASDSESPGSDNEAKNSQQPSSLPYVNLKVQSGSTIGGMEAMNRGNTEDFYARQARLQADARHALSQAKDLAKLQMSHEKEKRRYSPITEMVRNSLQKVGITLPPERRRVSRQLLTEMNVAQLQVIVNDLHSHIEELNEKLVSMLLDRDDLHMEQDSMLVDIEDLTRYLAAKDNSPHQSLPLIAPAKSLLGKK